MRNKSIGIIAAMLLSLSFLSQAQTFDQRMLSSMKWRMIGPHRGGRTVGAVGVPSQPGVFYMGVNNGGVWKTTDYGRVWTPIFDDQPTGSIGDVAVSPADPNIIYVGTGEGLQRPDLSVGNGMYRSADAGKTWKHIGLDGVQQIGGLAVDPTNANRIFVAALGHPYGPNTERGVYRSLDGGTTWKKVLYKDENTGAIQVVIDPKDPNTIYADLWAGRQGPWENGSWNGKESGLFKSTDGGDTWQKLTKGLPTTDMGLGRIGFCVAPSNNKRLYATVDSRKEGGLYRSDDAGETWDKLSDDERLWGRGSDFAEVKVDPTNEDIVYSANVVVWRSKDGGKKWDAFRGAPGGDDYHRIWIHPTDPKIMIIASDQGAIITVNGGETFSSWYNQPTAQFYHVSTDNAFPYNVYSGQQESGSVGIASRGNDGHITFREWHPVGAEEYGYVAADPLDPNIIYGGKLTRYDKRTGQAQNIAPEPVRSGNFRFIRTAPVLFSPIDPKTLFYAGNVIFKTRDGGNSWKIISPDLSRKSYDEIPANVGIYANDDMKRMARRGVVYTLAPSYKDTNVIWAGTDDGLIHVTTDGGKNWKDVTPPQLTPWSKVSLMDASHTDVNTCYAAVNRIRLDDMRPHIYKTQDGGKTWKEIVNGLPEDPINVVKEDPVRKGLLFAGSERAVYVSFDDGEHWQSLRLNMPCTSIRDLCIKDDDLVIGTHGRSFWILDNITPLRQWNDAMAQAPVVLYKPQTAIRVRWNMNTDTPLPQEEPAGDNPPDGAVIDYRLQQDAKEVKLEIVDAKGKVIRTYSSNDKPYEIPAVNIPHYWIRPQQVLSAKAGHQRFTWDLHYDPLQVPASYPIAAVFQNTEPDATAPWAMPGNYTVRLTVDGRTTTQPLVLKMDPRVKTSLKDLQVQHDLSVDCYEARRSAQHELEVIADLRMQVADRLTKAEGPGVAALKQFDEQLAAFIAAPPQAKEKGFEQLSGSFATLFNLLHDSDWPPTVSMKNTAEMLKTQFSFTFMKWFALKQGGLQGINQLLRQQLMKELTLKDR